MTYGDGDGTSYGPLVSLDVAGHEMSHGVTENTAGLTYSGESGGLNEATSDIFGTMVEFYANNANDPGDYLIGEQFDLKKHLGLRRMDNPASDGSSLQLLVDQRQERRRPLQLRASATTSSTCSPKAPAPRRSTASRTTHRPATARRSPGSAEPPPEDLVPGADGLHDLQHQLQGCPDRNAERRQGPLRLGQHPILHGRRCMERGLRVLTSLPPPEVRSPRGGGPVLGTRAPRPLHLNRLSRIWVQRRAPARPGLLGCPGRALTSPRDGSARR